MLIKDQWYAACPTKALTNDAPKSISVGEIDLVLFRDRAGKAHALLDQCCHRGVKLSLGRICDGNLACGYHGWEYDGAGNVVKIPSLPDQAGLPAYSVPKYESSECDGYVWVWIAGQHQQPSHAAGMPILNDLGGYWGQRTEIWDADIVDAVENQMDFAHTAFSHPGTYPGHTPEKPKKRLFAKQKAEPESFTAPIRQMDIECRLHSGGVEAFIPATDDGAAAIPGWRALNGWARFELPYRNFVFLTEQRVLAIYNWVPLQDGKCRLEFMFSAQELDEHGNIPIADGSTKHINLWPLEVELLTQDRVLLESAKQWMGTGTRDFEVSVMADFPQLQTRRLCHAAQQGKMFDSAQEEKRMVFKAVV